MRTVILLAACLALLAYAPTAVAAKPACNDGVDNDGDGATDYPADTGCTGKGDNDESNAAPPPPPPPPPGPVPNVCTSNPPIPVFVYDRCNLLVGAANSALNPYTHCINYVGAGPTYAVTCERSALCENAPVRPVPTCPI